jgi:DNA polymerase V
MQVQQIYSSEEIVRTISVPLLLHTISAGFPSPAEDWIDKKLDLNELMVQRPTSTFFVRVKGDSMRGAGIIDGDLLVVDRAVEPKHRDVVLVIVEGEFTVKRWICQGQKRLLQPENTNYPVLDLSLHSDWQVWGVVLFAVHSLRERGS